jgi:hypothetical protein
MLIILLLLVVAEVLLEDTEAVVEQVDFVQL